MNLLLVLLLALIAQVFLLIVGLVVRVWKNKVGTLKARASSLRHGEVEAPKFVFTLIHGTWAQDAGWTLQGSVLCSELVQSFNAVLFHRFRWSGRNTIRARATAAAALKKHLIAISTKYPQSKSFIIAHSHGGNVALSALDASIEESVNGVICLATPVIISRPRHLDPMIRTFLPLAGTLPIIGSIVIALAFNLKFKWALFAGVIASLAQALASKLFLKRLQSFLDSTYYDKKLEDKLLFVRAPGDEASVVISAVQGLSWALSKLLLFPVRVSQLGAEQIDCWRSQLGGKSAVGLLAVVLIAATTAIFGSDRSSDVVVVGGLIIAGAGLLLFLGLFVGGYVGRLAGYLFLPLFLVPIFFLIILSGLAIGPELTIASLARDVTVEPCPRGMWKVIMLGDFDLMASRDLQHSLVYRSEEACDAIITWLKERE